jgi:hypothetical protein
MFSVGALLLVILILIGLIEIGQDRNVWERWTESRSLRTMGYSERIYINDVFRTRANTWSNLAFVLVGFYSFALGRQDFRRPTPSDAGYLVRTPALSYAFGLACCYLGFASGLGHASLTRFGQHLDVASMYAPLLVLIAVNLGRWFPRLTLGGKKFPTWPIWISFVIVACVFLFVFKWSMSSKKVLGTLVATVSLLTLLDRFPNSRKTKVGWLVGSSAALVAGVVCRQLDAAGRFSGPDAWFQGHALWHVLTGLSLGCMYFYYRSEAITAPALTRESPRSFDGL